MKNEIKIILGVCFVIILCLGGIAKYRIDYARQQEVKRHQKEPPPSPKVRFNKQPAPNCEPGAEWRDSEGDNIFTLINGKGRQIARVFPSTSYVGYWDVVVGTALRPEVQFSEKPQAISHAEGHCKDSFK